MHHSPGSGAWCIFALRPLPSILRQNQGTPMQLGTIDDCRAYVEGELRRLIHSHPGWHSGRSTEVPVRPLTWSLGRGVEGGWYLPEARMAEREFLIWFGNHQVGAGSVHWIMRPAVHVAFEDLQPRSDPVGIRISLCDVLDCMIRSLDGPEVIVTRFELNTFSLT